MKESKRANKALKSLELVSEYLNYYMGSGPQFQKFNKENINLVSDLIKELSLDQKTQNARLAKKLKNLWNSNKV